MGKDIVVCDLLADYGLWAGGIAVDGDEDLYTVDVTPLTYLDEFINCAYQPPKEVCREFLELFYKNSPVMEHWWDSIAWEEDENEEEEE